MRRHSEAIPVNAGDHVANKLWLEVQLLHLKLGIMEVKWKRGGRSLAILDRAGHKVGGNDLHGLVVLVFGGVGAAFSIEVCCPGARLIRLPRP